MASTNYISFDSSNVATSSVGEINTQLQHYLSLLHQRLCKSRVQGPGAEVLAFVGLPTLPIDVCEYLLDNVKKPKCAMKYTIEKKEWLLRLVKAVLRKMDQLGKEVKRAQLRQEEANAGQDEEEKELNSADEEENIAAMFTDSSDDEAEGRHVQRISDTVLYRMSNDCKSWHEKKERDKQRE